MTDHASEAAVDELPAVLADVLRGQGDIRDAAWRDAWSRVPRHVFVPAFARTVQTSGGTQYELVTSETDRGAWLAGVYGDGTLIVQIDGESVADALADGPGSGRHTSSSTAPGLMAWMLDVLDVADGHTVLELGTGTGYNAALLSARLGDHAVTTVDIDDALTGAARDRLAALGFHPTVVTGDARDGYPAGAPYDRVIATCSFPSIPPAWVAQTRPGGRILTNVAGWLGGAMLLATVADDCHAEGRFLPRWAGFMADRNRSANPHDITAVGTEDGEYEAGATTVPAGALNDPVFAFVAQLHLGDVRPYWATAEDGRDITGLITPDGSWSEVYASDTETADVEQGGPRRLWAIVEEAWRWWSVHGRPGFEEFGVTVGPDGQYAWCGSADTSWPLSG